VIVRIIEGDPDVGAALQEVEGLPPEKAEKHPVLVAARERAELAAREQLGKLKHPKVIEPPAEATTITCVRDGDVLRGEGVHRGRLIRLEVEGDDARLTDAGKASKVPS
jgi:hypothetical protein